MIDHCFHFFAGEWRSATDFRCLLSGELGRMRRKNRESSRMRRALPSAKFANRIFSGRPASAPAHRLRRPLRGQPDWKKCWRMFG